jgi:hypothetical protein
VPGELLRYLGGPDPYSAWWLAGGVAIAAAIMIWCAGVLVWTMPAQRLRRIPLIRTLHARLVRRKFTGSIRAARDGYRTGQLSAAQCAAAMRGTLRGFLAVTTGDRAHFMHVADMETSDLASVAPMFSALNDAQFNTGSRIDVDGVGHQAEELIRSWN